jgi:hypothetical protein
MKVMIYKIVFSSGICCRTYEYEQNIYEVASRLQQSYAKYYNVSHTIQEIICEPETEKHIQMLK